MSKARQLADLGNQVDDGAITGSNMVVNGAMTVAQREDGTGLTASGYHGPDRFKFNQSGRDQFQVSVSQDSDGPDGYSNSWKLQTTTAENAIDSTEYVICQHRIEAQNLQHLSYGNSNAEQVTLSFWVKSSIAATYSVYLYASDGVEIIGSTYTINTASTWEYKTVTFAGNTSSAINHDNGAGVDIGFILAAGSGMRTTSNTSWTAYANDKLAYGHTDAANAVMTTANATWQITGVCLNVGDSAIDFPHESYGDTLAKCQRYFERQTGIDGIGVSSSASNCYGGALRYNFKRTTPTISIRDSGGTANKITWNTAGVSGENVSSSVTSTTISATRPFTTSTTSARNSFVISVLDIDAEL